MMHIYFVTVKLKRGKSISCQSLLFKSEEANVLDLPKYGLYKNTQISFSVIVKTSSEMQDLHPNWDEEEFHAEVMDTFLNDPISWLFS